MRSVREVRRERGANVRRVRPVAFALLLVSIAWPVIVEGQQNNTLTAVGGLAVGHYTLSARPTGCTVVLAEPAAVAAVDVRGAAPGTRETDLLNPLNTVDRVDTGPRRPRRRVRSQKATSARERARRSERPSASRGQ